MEKEKNDLDSSKQKEIPTSTEIMIEVRAKAGKFNELYQTLQGLIPLIRKEKECKECRIYRDVDDGEIFNCLIHWESLSNFKHYMRSNTAVALLGAMDLLTENVRVRINKDEPWEGIEILKRMKRQSAHKD